MIKLGEYNTLTVLRKSDLGYMLSDGKNEILMHFKQATRELNNNEVVNVFVYADKAKRLTATMLDPYCDLEKPGFVVVKNVIPDTGVFVDINTPKDVLVSKDYLPYNPSFWPTEGDILFVKLKVKGDTLVAKPLNRYEINEVSPKMRYSDYESVKAYVYHASETGIAVITKDKISVFVPKDQLRGTYRMGQEVNVTITKMQDKICYGTLNPHKEILMDEDKDLILNYLRKNGGVMHLTAKSSAESIEGALHISRKAFKRAYGGLYKDQKIDFDEEKTRLL